MLSSDYNYSEYAPQVAPRGPSRPSTQSKRCRIACVRCRKRKIKCSPADGPSCHRCAQRSLACEYMPVADEESGGSDSGTPEHVNTKWLEPLVPESYAAAVGATPQMQADAKLRDVFEGAGRRVSMPTGRSVSRASSSSSDHLSPSPGSSSCSTYTSACSPPLPPFDPEPEFPPEFSERQIEYGRGEYGRGYGIEPSLWNTSAWPGHVLSEGPDILSQSLSHTHSHSHSQSFYHPNAHAGPAPSMTQDYGSSNRSSNMYLEATNAPYHWSCPV